MNFALILFSLTVGTGLVALLYKLTQRWFARWFSLPGIRHIVEFSNSFFIVFLAVLVIRSFVIEPFRIPSGSLKPTLLVGDFVAVNKFSYGLRFPVWDHKFLSIGEPKRGDIVVFSWPVSPKFDYIKRVVGLPGDHIQYTNKVFTINGKLAKQRFLNFTIDNEGTNAFKVEKRQENLLGVVHDIYVRPDVKDLDFDITVPKGHYFMVGDNRDNSSDSRYWGFVAEKHLRGKAFAIWMSWNNLRTRVRFNRIGMLIH